MPTGIKKKFKDKYGTKVMWGGKEAFISMYVPPNSINFKYDLKGYEVKIYYDYFNIEKNIMMRCHITVNENELI